MIFSNHCRKIRTVIGILPMILVLFFTANHESSAQCSNNNYDTGGSSGNYGNNEDYTKTYTVPTGYKVRFNFIAFNTQASNDIMTVYDGPTTASPVIGTFSGTSLPSPIISSSNTLTYRFVSNGSTTASGWNIAVTQVKTYTVNASSDDAEESSSGSIDLVSTDLELVEESSTQKVGIRFTNIDIKRGADLVNAFIRFKADEANSEATNLTLRGHKVTNSPTFTTSSNNISSRTTTTASKAWTSHPAWVIGNYYNSPDISNILEEIVGQSGWNSGNALSIIITGTGKRVAESYDGGDVPATLVVEYCLSEICDNGIDDDEDGLTDCPDLDCGFVVDRQFDNGLTSWFSYNQSGNSSTVAIDKTSQLSGQNSAFIDITSASGTDWHIQFGQGGFSFVNGTTYEVRFDAKAAAAKQISLSMQLNADPWTTYFYQTINLTTSPSSHTFTFTANATVTNQINMLFNLAQNNTDVWIDNVQFKEVCAGSPSCTMVGEWRLDGDAQDDSGNANHGTIIGGPSFPSGQVQTAIDLNGSGEYIDLGNPSELQLSGDMTIMMWLKPNDFSARRNPWAKAYGGEGTITQETNGTLNFYWGTSGINGGTYTSFGTNSSLALNQWTHIAIVRDITGNSVKWYINGILDKSGTPAMAGSVSALPAYIGRGYLSDYSGGIDEVKVFDCALSAGDIQTIYDDELTPCESPTFSFQNPTLQSGSPLQNGAVYRFSNVLPGVDADMTIVSRSHSDIEINSIDEPAITNGGYDDAIQPIIDYNFVNGGGSFDPPGDKTVTFRIDFHKAGTSVDTIIALATLTGLDIDGSNDAGEIREFIQTSTYDSYSTQTSTQLTLSGALKALGPITTYDGVDETALDVMVSFNKADLSTITYTFGANYGGSTTMVDGDEKRLNSLYLKCYNLNNTVCDVDNPIPVHGSSCGPGTVELTANGCGNDLEWFDVPSGGSPIYTGEIFTTPVLSSTTTYYVQCDVQGCKSNRVAVTATIHSVPVISYTGPTNVCVGGTSSVSPTSGGVWTSSNPSVATVTNAGVISGVGPGAATFTYTQTSSGCPSNPSAALNVFATPTASISGKSKVCKSGADTLIASGGSQYLWSTGDTTALIEISPNSNTTYFVTVTNANGCSAVASKSVTVSNCFGQICFNGNNNVTATANWNITFDLNPANDRVKIRATLSKNFVDNSYGANIIGWPSSRSFNSLVGSDHLIVAMYDTLNVKKMEVKMDYLSASGAVPSGYKSLGVTGGDGSMIFGNVSDVLSVKTSMDANFNDFGYVLTTDSPVSDIFYTPDPNYPNWIFDVWYEIEVKLSAFGSAGFGTVNIAGAHASPSKTGNNTEPVSPGPCCTMDVEITGDSLLCESESTTLTANYNTINTIYLAPTDDTYLWEDKPEDNFGDENKLKIGLDSGDKSRSLVKFDLSGFPNNATILSAKLGLQMKDADNYNPADISVHRMTTDWVENTGGSNKAPSWNKRAAGVFWNTVGGDFISTPEAVKTVSIKTEYFWDIKNLVSGWVANTYNNYGVLFKMVNEGTSTRKNFYSRDEGDESRHPQLIIEYSVPADPANVSVLWSNNQTTNSISVTPPATATYKVTVSELGGCYGSDSVDVVVLSKPTTSITGPSTICEGSTTTLSPTTGGTWTSSNTNVATVTNSGVVTGIGAGTATFTFTNTSTGCTSNASAPITVNGKPVVSITGPSTICEGATSTLSPTTGGIWTSSNTDVATVTNSGVVTGISAGTATFTFTNSSTNCASNPSAPITVNPKPSIAITGPSTICEGATTTLSPTSGGTWTSSNTSVATVTNLGVVSGIGAGTATFTFTNASTGCVSNASTPITVNAKPIVSITGPSTICVSSTTSLSPSSGGTWVSSDPAVATVSNSGIVTGISAGNATFTFTNSATGCASNATSTITVNAKPDVSIDFNGSICLTDTSKLTALVSGGTAPFSYSWTGPNGFTGSTPTVDINENGNFYITVTDNNGCSDETSGFVYQQYDPFIFTLNTTICEGESVTLEINSASAVAYQWGANAGNSTDSSVVVSPLPPSETYLVTVTNDLGCTSTASATIDVDPKPTVSVTGPSTICEGSTTTLSPTTGGTWVSNNPGVATVTNAGLVTGVSAGSTTFTFTNTATGCVSNASTAVTILAKPMVSITGPDEICIGYTTTLTPTSGGVWASGDTSIATITNGGVVTGIAAGTVTFVFTNSSTGCASNASAPLTVHPTPVASISGPSTICVGSTTMVSPSSGGVWTSSNTSVATVNNSGVVSGISAGSATFTYTNSTTGCVSNATASLTVSPNGSLTISGPNEVCMGSVIDLNASSGGGIWSSSNTNIATVNNSGLVTPVAPGDVIISYDHNSNSCFTEPSHSVTVHAKPIPNITGPSTICEGSTTTLSPTSGGVWTSSNTNVATVTNAGVVTGVSAGSATFTFTNSTTGCSSDASAPVTIDPKPIISITGPSTICEGSTTTLSPTTGGTWSSSNPAVASVTNAGVVTGVAAGTVTFTFTNSATGCASNNSAPITIDPKPLVSVTGPSTICAGSTTQLSPTSGGTWTSNNPAVATVTNAGVVTGVAGGSVTFTFTNSATGCVSNATTSVTVQNKPVVSIAGPSAICVGNTTGLLPNSGGTWESTNTNVATITSTGIITGLSAGDVGFIFTNTSTGCASDTFDLIEINPNPSVAIDFNGSICLTDTSKLSADVTGGTPVFSYNWNGPNGFSSTLEEIDITDNGNYYVTVTDSKGCTDDIQGFVYQRYEPFIFTLNTQVCEGESVSLSVNSGTAVAYLWDANAGNATSQSVTVFPTPPSTTYTVTVTNNIGCTTTAASNVGAYSKPVTSVSGDTEICPDATTQLNPSSGGTWSSLNPGIATITDSGLVTGISAGTTSFVFTDTITGCNSDPSIPITVGTNQPVTITGSNDVCLGDSIQLNPSVAGGTWESADENIATVSQDGVVTAVAIGATTINYIPISSECYTTSPHSVTVRNVPNAQVVGGSIICEGETTLLVPTSGGTWISNDPSIASITNSGVVTGLSDGYANFTFTSIYGCTDSLDADIQIVGKVDVSLVGPSNICVGSNTQLAPSSGGIWVSNNSSIASVNASGLITGNAAGSTYFTFYESVNGCASDSLISITVNGKPNPTFTGPTTICIGETTTLTPASGGTWVSDNPSVATISNTGLVTALAAGTARFTFTNTATGCVSNKSQPLFVNNIPNADLGGFTQICIGSNITLNPSSGGTWTSSDPSVATVNGSGVATGTGVGTVYFVFENNATGCSSNPTDTLQVTERPQVSYTGPTTICAGQTSSVTPSTGGTWASSNNNIATITNSGLITGITGGNVTFTFTSSDNICTSDPTTALTVVAKPVIGLNGPSVICVGSQTYFTPATGGTWVSSNPAVASITNAGEVSGLSSGTATFTYTSNSTGCSSSASSPITVNPKPVVQITGSPGICVGGTTNLSPTSGGSWISSNTNIATVNSSGLVTGLSVGTVTFTFVQSSTGCSSNPTSPLTVSAKPQVSITGPSSICAGNTTTLSPTSGGFWTSDNPSVATVAANGVVTGLSQGIVKFTFTSDAGCVSNKTSAVTVYSKPVAIVNDSSLCIGSQINLMPSSGGVWTSTNNAIATINNSGVVTGVAQGVVQFIFTENSTGCTSNPSSDVTVYPKPQVAITGPSAICIGSSTQLTPTTGGLWYSNNPGIATVNNSGLVTGLSAGTATFYFVNLTTNCVSNNSAPVTVNSKPQPQFTGPSSLCIGENTTMSPSTGGTWTSVNPSIATITNAGVVTALAQGTAKFRFTNSATGCQSDLSGPLNVNGQPSVGLIGAPAICVDGTTNVYPASGGTWQSTNTAILTITNDGTVSGISAGTANLIFTDAQTGCTSDGNLSVDVNNPPVVQLEGDATICVGFTSEVSAIPSGVWVSSDNRIATVTSNGIVKGLVPGMVTISFIDGATGCSSGSNSAEIEVVKCFNPDFNVTLTNMAISGNLSTNDDVPENGSYSPVITVVSKPSGSNPSLTINTDGTYTFLSDAEGKYVYDVQICEAPMINGCPRTPLEITVLGNVYSDNNPVNNPEFGTTFANANDLVAGDNIVVSAVGNDKCVNTLGCSLDITNSTIMGGGTHGTKSLNGSGSMSYTPDAAMIGYDTITYKICTMDGLICSESSYYLTVNHHTASNSTVAPDDFNYTMAETTVTGNVMTNDSDPEGDNIAVQPQGAPGSEISVAEGSYYILSDGSYAFTPAPGFEGAVEIIYTLCDDNADTACMDATLHLLVFGEMSLNIRVYLEGALMNNGNLTSNSGRPLMRDNLRFNPNNGQNEIPLSDPYSGQVGFIDLSASYDHVGPGLLAVNKVISDSAAVFSVTGQNAIVDWVHIELRNKADMYQIIATRSALVQRDGDVVDLDGVSPVRFNGIAADSFYMVIKHRSHLGAMSMLVSNNQMVDFTDPNLPLFNFGYDAGSGLDYTGLSMNANVKSGYRALWAGDFDSNGKIKYTNPSDDKNFLFFEVIVHGDNTTGSANFDEAFGYTQGDFNMNGKAKYTNPSDDTNLLFAQVLLYPLNTFLFDNFNYFIEQVPRITYKY